MSAPVEKTTRYVTTVDDLPAAWAFVMEYVDKVGPDPSVSIRPLWNVGIQDMGHEEPEGGWAARQFEVVVDGMVPSS